jgi:hypothetical protein
MPEGAEKTDTARYEPIKRLLPWANAAIIGSASALFCAVYYFQNYHARKAAILLFCAGLACDILRNQYHRTGSGTWYFRSVSLIFCATSIALCVLHLVSVWQHSTGNYWCFGGLLPFSDPGGFYHGARSLIEFGSLDDFSSRRPLVPGLYAFFLLCTHQNLQLTLLIVSIFVGISMYFPVIEITKRFGICAGTIVQLAMFGHISEYLVTTLSEPLGLIYGNFACAFLLRGMTGKRPFALLTGIALLALALSIRPGPMFVLAFIIIWSGFVLGRTARYTWRFILSGTALSVAIMATSVVGTGYCNPGRESNVNGSLAYTMYEFATGKHSLSQPAIDHPELNDPRLSDAERVQMIYRYAFKEIRTHPLTVPREIVKAYGYAATHARDWFSPLYPLMKKEVCLFFFLLSLMSIVLFGRQYQTIRIMLLLSVAGIIITLPIMLFGGSRILSAVEPLLSSVFAIGTITLLQKVRVLPVDTGCSPETGKNVPTLAFFSIGMSIIGIAAPFLIHATSIRPDFSKLPRVQEIQSSPGLSPVVFRASKGSTIHMVSDSTLPGLPDVRMRDFKGWAPYAPFSDVREGDYVINLLNLLMPNEYAYLVLDVDPAGYSGHFCLLEAQKQKDKDCTVYYGRRLEIIPRL